MDPQSEAPYFQSLAHYVRSQVLSFHMPGHQQGAGAPAEFVEPVGRAALAASREMLALEPEEKAQALRLMAAGVRNAAEKIIRENVLDMEEARKSGRNSAFLDRLLLTPDRVEHMACSPVPQPWKT